MTFTTKTARAAAIKGNTERWKNMTPAQYKKACAKMRKLAAKRWKKV